MTTDTQQIVNKAWNYAHVLRDDGLSYMAYTEQITFLLFLKMADEQTKPPYNKPPIVPAKFNWESLHQYLKGHQSPASWFEEAKLNDAMRWLGRGYVPARRTWYEFRDRARKFIEQVHQQFIARSLE